MSDSSQRTRSIAPFLVIWSGQVFSLIGSHVVQFALVWWLTRETGSATVLATASAVALLPQIFLGPFAGALVDRWNRRLVMIAADVVSALASLWLAALFIAGQVQIWHVFAAMLVRAVAGNFHWPAMEASTTLMVPEKHLARVAGLNQTMHGVLNIFGPPLGALLMAVLPLHGVMLVDVVTAAFAVAPLLFIAVPPPPRAPATLPDGVRTSLWAELREGVRYVQGWRGIQALLAIVLVMKVLMTPAFSLIPLLVARHFNGDAGHLSLFEAVAGIGIVLGGLALTVWGGSRRRIYTSLSGLTALGFGFVLIGLTPSTAVAVALGGIFVIGLVIPLIDGPINAILQATVAPEVQGRVFALLGSLSAITSPIGLAIAGPVTDAVGLQVWYVAAGALCAAMGALAFFIPSVVNIEQYGEGRADPPESWEPAVVHAVVELD